MLSPMALARNVNLARHREDGPHLLADAVKAAREDLGYSQEEVLARGGPSRDRLSAIEHARNDQYSSRVLLALEAALWWRPGSIEQILQGGAPEWEPNRPSSEHGPRDAPRRLEQADVDSYYQFMLFIGRQLGRQRFTELVMRVHSELDE